MYAYGVQAFLSAINPRCAFKARNTHRIVPDGLITFSYQLFKEEQESGKLNKHRSVAADNVSAPVALLLVLVEGGVCRALDARNNAAVVALVEPPAVHGVRDVPIARPLARLVDDRARSR